MQKEIKFAVDEIKRIKFSDYDEQDYCIARLGFISTRPNSHKIIISEEALRKSASTALGTWVVADVQFGDATTHTEEEYIVGVVPKDQEVGFEYDEEGYLRAYVDAIISKRYAAEFCEIFKKDNNRAVSIEAKFDMEDEYNAKSFDIKGITVLGRGVRPSCPQSDITFVRFSEEDAIECYSKWHKKESVWELKKFVEERKQSMAENKSYKIDKSKEAMSEKAWGEIDKADLRNKIMEASNRATLVKAVYMLVEDGWEEAPSEHLKYPVMCFEGDTLVYNRDGLASALGYAKKENETAVVNKVEKIYKKLDLESDGKEEKMEEVKDVEMTEAIDESAVEMAEPEKEQVEEKEEKSEKMAEEKCEEAECAEDAVEMTAEEMKAKIAELEKSVEERDHIIMDKDGELEELRAFQNSVYEKERAKTVESVMSDIKEYVDALTFNDLREEGLACNFSELDGWANKAKALCFGAVKKSRQKANLDTTVWSFAAPVEPVKKNTSIWD